MTKRLPITPAPAPLEEYAVLLSGFGVGYVLALKESHSWWHKEGQIGALWEAALGGRMEERRGARGVEGGGKHLPRRAPGDMVGAGG